MIFVAALVLMANMLGLKRLGKAVNTEKDLVLVVKSIEMLRALRYECARLLSSRWLNTECSVAAQDAHLRNAGVRALIAYS